MGPFVLLDPSVLLVAVMVASVLGSISPMLEASGWRQRMAVFFRSISLGTGVPLIFHHKLGMVGGDVQLLVGLAAVMPVLGERLVVKLIKKKLGIHDEKKPS